MSTSSTTLRAVIVAATLLCAVQTPRLAEAKVAATKADAAKATALIAKITAMAPGRERYKAVDQLIDLGDAAWPTVQAALPRLSQSREGESVVVDVLLGFMDLSYEAMPAWLPKLSDGAARRVTKFLLRLKADKRQHTALKSLMGRRDRGLLLLVLPALMGHDRPAVLRRMLTLIDDPRPEMSAYAIDTVATHRYKPAMSILVRLLGIESKRASAKNLDQRRKLIHAIARLGGEPAVPPLLEALNLKDQHEAVFEGMREVGQPAVQAALFLLKTASGARIALAMDLLSYMRHQACPKLIEMLSESNRSTRDVIIDVLTRIATPEVRPQLIDMVKTRRFADVKDGIRLLATLYNADVREVFFDLLDDKDPAVRSAVIERLWRLRDKKTFRALRLLAAQDPNPNVRMLAVKAVAGVGDPAGVELLQRMGSATDPFIRREVIEQLARVGDWRDVVPTLADLLADPNDRVFREAMLALQRLTFQPMKRRGGQWLAWYRASKAVKPAPKPRPHERAFRSGRWRFAASQAGEDGPAVLFVSGPPFRDSSHMEDAAFALSHSARVAWMRRAPGTYRSARQTQRTWTREVDALARAARFKRYVLVTDTAGASYALRHARARKAARAVIVDGGWLPNKTAADALPKQLMEAMDEAATADLKAAAQSHWHLALKTRLRLAWRAMLRMTLERTAFGFTRAAFVPLADDALSPAVRVRALRNAARVQVKRINKPVLLMLGAKAPWAKTVPDAAKANPRIKTKQFAMTSASPLTESLQASVSTINEFIDGLR